MSRRRGFTLAEMLTALFLAGFVTTISAMALMEASGVWRKASSRDALGRSISKSWSALRRDLENAKQSASTLNVTKVPASFPGAADGDALIFLSPVDPTTQNLCTKASDGSPFMMRNIIYYLVVPQNHNIIFKQNCVGAADSNGYEMNCPHKVLIRCQEDFNPSGSPANPNTAATENILIPTWTTYLTRPSSLGVLNGDQRRIVANNLLTFRVTPDTVTHMLKLEIRAVAIEEANRKIAVGTVQLTNTPYTVTQQTSIVTRN